MLSWLRPLILLAPFGVVYSLYWLGGQARQLDYRVDTDLVVSAPLLPESFNPINPRPGLEREVTELVFDRWLRLDDDLRLQPHLLEAWRYDHWITWHFESEEAAAEAATRIEAVKDHWSAWSIEELLAEGDVVVARSTDPTLEWTREVEKRFDRETLSPLLHVRLTVDESVRASVEAFREEAVEDDQVHHVDFEGDRVADFYLRGETDLFLKELRLYYESNRNLDPRIEVIGPESVIRRLTFELRIKDGFRWHDGKPVSSKDFLFTFRELTRPGSSWPWRGAFPFVDQVELIDESGIRVYCREFYAPALERWAKLPLLPAHRLSETVGPEGWEAYFRDPVGTGPFRFQRGGTAGEFELLAEAGYPVGRPRQHRIRYRAGPPGPERRLAVGRGLIDLFEPDLHEQAEIASGNLEVEVARDLPRVQHAVVWNLDREPFRDPRVRHALACLVDVPGLVAEAGEGRMREWSGLFFPGAWFCPETTRAFAQEVDRAGALLDEAGWTWSESDGDGGAGSWQKAGDEKTSLGFRLGFDRESELSVRLAEGLAIGWRSQGVEVALEPMSWSSLLDAHLAPRRFDALLLNWEIDFSRDQFAVWHSSEAGPGGSNFSGFRNQEVDHLLESLRIETSEPKIIELATTLQREIRELQPCLFLGGTGREITWRKGAVLQARPEVERPGEIGIARPVSVGPAGLYASRAWWFRNPADVLESRSGSGEGESEPESAERSPAVEKGGLP